MSRRTQWPVESTSPVHVLAVFRLLLLPDTVNVVPWHFGVLSASEVRETHRFAHLCFDAIIFLQVASVDVHVVYVMLRFRRSLGIRLSICSSPIVP
jgi:hypothetical protein